MTGQKIPVYVINLDRRTDRRDFMAAELARAGVDWIRFSAVDAKTVSDDDIAREVQMADPVIEMGRGSQCCAISNFNIYRALVASEHPAAMIMQDDICVDAQIGEFLTDLDWLPPAIGLVQFEKYKRWKSRKLAGPGHDTGRAGRKVHRMYSRAGGAGCYVIRRETAEMVLAHKGLLAMPIDHFLFSPNVSPLFDRMGVGFVAPAMAVQQMHEFASDLVADRAAQKKDLPTRVRRMLQEANRLPHQVGAYLRGARFVDFDLPDNLIPEGIQSGSNPDGQR